MELDELKQAWNETPPQNQLKTNIMEIIQNKSYGPLAELKHTYRKQMVVMAIFPLLLLTVFERDMEGVLSSVLFWSYVAFCLGVVGMASYNYRLVKRMQSMDGVVKSTLEGQIALLEKRVRLELWGLRGAVLFFIVLLEVLPYFQHYHMLDKWHALPVLVRVGVYAGFLLFQLLVGKRIKQRKVGRHLAYLRSVVDQMQ